MTSILAVLVVEQRMTSLSLVKLLWIRFLGNCPPTPPLSHLFALSEKQVLMLPQGRGRWAVSQKSKLIRCLLIWCFTFLNGFGPNLFPGPSLASIPLRDMRRRGPWERGRFAPIDNNRHSRAWPVWLYPTPLLNKLYLANRGINFND